MQSHNNKSGWWFYQIESKRGFLTDGKLFITDSPNPSQMEKKATEIEHQSENNTIEIEEKEDDKSSTKSTLEDLNLLTKLFPKVDKTTLVDSLLVSNGDTMVAIQKLLSSDSKEEPPLQAPQEKKRLPPPSPPPVPVLRTAYSPKPDADTKLGISSHPLSPRNVAYNSAQQRYMAAAAAAAAVAASGVNPPAGVQVPAGTGNSHQYANSGFSAFLPNAWFRPELAQYLNSTRGFLGHPGFAQNPYFLSRMANAGSAKFGRSTLSPPPLTPLHHSYGSILTAEEPKFGKSASSSITGDADVNTLSPSHSD